MAKTKHTGRAWIFVDGQLYESGDDAKLSGAVGIKRNIVKGAEIYGFTEEIVEASVEASFFHGNGLSLAAFRTMDDVTITFQCDSGATYTLANAWFADGKELGAKDGKVGVTFTAKKADETLS